MTRRTILLPLLLTTLCILAGASAAHAQGGGHRAALVVRFADGGVETRCVAFSEPSITGADLLTRSGLQIIMDYNSGSGGAVCSIAGAGCAFPSQDCFCRCQGLTCEYWAYYHWAGGWQYSQVGAGSYEVTDGALEGWSWGPGNWSSGTEPPPLTFAEVCSSPATATPTATTTATPTATPSATVAPSQNESSPPQIVFETNATELAPGACTVLRWLVSDAVQVSLDGTAVMAHDQKEVCPTTTQRFILAANNSAGQTMREITVTVSGSEDAPVQAPMLPGPTATRPLSGGAPATPSVTPTLLADALRRTDTPVLGAPVAQHPTSTPQPSQPGLPGISVVHAQEITSVATRKAPVETRLSSAAIKVLLVAETPTPRPRRQLGADGRLTPTPILLAYVGPADSAALRSDARTRNSDQNSEVNGNDAPDRNFSLTLLPGYAAFLFTAASLAGAGVWVARRKAAVTRRS